jgi:phage tail-like protein
VRGQIHDARPGAEAGPGIPASAAYRVSGPVPALFHDDPLFLGLCAAFDELLSPVIAALDCFAAYLDPSLAPDDFVAWLAALVGADAGADAPQPSPPRRALVAGAVRGYRARGTAAGLRDAVAAAAGVPADRVSVAESAGGRSAPASGSGGCRGPGGWRWSGSPR